MATTRTSSNGTAGHFAHPALLALTPPPELRITAWSGDAPRLLGRSNSELAGMPLAELVDSATGGATVHDEIQRGLRDPSALLPLSVRTRDGRALLHASTVPVLRGAQTTPESVVLLLREPAASDDITERLAAAQDECARLREGLEQFIYAASHDLKEPVRIITSFVQLLQRRYDGKLDHEANEIIGFICDGTLRLRAMLDGLTDYARVTTRGTPPRPIDMKDALQRACAQLEEQVRQKGAQIHHADLPVVHADHEQLVRLFRELLANALEFHGHAPPHITIEAQVDGGMCTVAVRDNGIGIDPRHHETIFGGFQRLHPRSDHAGVGMGLMIARHIVGRHGGRLWVESRPGDGSVFRFTLPTAVPSIASTPLPTER